jgi:hypothetical protein
VRRFSQTNTSSTVTIVPIQAFQEDIFSGQSLASLLSNPRDLFNGLYAFILLRASVAESSFPVDTQAIDAEKRLVIFDPVIVKVAILEARRLFQEQNVMIDESLGLPNLCTTVPETQVQAIFQFLDQRVPNRAPVYTDLLVRYEGTETATSVARGEQLRAAPGETIALRGIAAPNDKEDYRILTDDCELEDVKETLAFSWFTSSGLLDSNITVDGKNTEEDDQYVEYTAPTEDLLGGAETMTVNLYSILRDGRGGSDSRVIEIVVDRAFRREGG